MLSILLAASIQAAAPATSAQAHDMPPPLPAPQASPPRREWPTSEADFIVRNHRFRSGETLPEVRLHYTTLGQPRRNAAGEIDNAVMVLHGTGGTGKQFLSPTFANDLYGPGEPLDISKYWIILPDNVGHGGSSKPSDGLRMRFPKYGYHDMIDLQHILLTQGLGIKRMRLIMGTSMGCMHSFMWGQIHPDFAEALMPLACMPIEIAGLNRMWRELLVEGIRNDPAWMGGNYETQPVLLQARHPTGDQAIAAARAGVARDIASRDANDMIYQFESSRDYNPWPGLDRITAPLTWINSADDFINPRNFPYPALAMARMPNGRFRLIAESSDTRGHGTHTSARFWKQDLIELLQRSGD
jgi:homoserine O-acetyltransferase